VGKRRNGSKEWACLLVLMQNRSMGGHLKVFNSLLLQNGECPFKIVVADFLKLVFAG
jgi:hypothetical protein